MLEKGKFAERKSVLEREHVSVSERDAIRTSATEPLVCFFTLSLLLCNLGLLLNFCRFVVFCQIVASIEAQTVTPAQPTNEAFGSSSSLPIFALALLLVELASQVYFCFLLRLFASSPLFEC